MTHEEEQEEIDYADVLDQVFKQSFDFIEEVLNLLGKASVDDGALEDAEDALLDFRDNLKALQKEVE